jgi:hypothetical protein
MRKPYLASSGTYAPVKRGPARGRPAAVGGPTRESSSCPGTPGNQLTCDNSPLPQTQRGGASGCGLIGALVDTLGHDVRDQEMRIRGAVIDHIVEFGALRP